MMISGSKSKNLTCILDGNRKEKTILASIFASYPFSNSHLGFWFDLAHTMVGHR